MSDAIVLAGSGPQPLVGVLQDQINALETGLAGGTRIPFGLSQQMITPGQPVARGVSGDTVRALAGINNGNAASPIGVSIGDNLIQTSGVVTLPTATWDVITSQVGGLTPGATYCCGPGAGLFLIDCSSTEGGSILAPVGAIVGVALTTTELLLTPGSPPNTISGGAGVATAGEVVAQSASTFAAAISSSLAGCQSAVGIVVLQGGGGVPSIVAIDGAIATLATTVWDTVTGQSGGLTEGAIYYMSNVAAGHLLPNTAPATTGSFAVQVGVALSSTQMLVKLGTPIGPHA